jgi:hypothetical protein
MRPALAGLALAVAAMAPAAALAQSKEDLANADALFNAAKAMLDAGQYADACGKFAESKRLAPGLGVTLYLADCYERIGRTASAWTEFKTAEGLARARNDQRADVARGRAQALEAKLDRLTVVVGPTVARVGLHVLLDGAPVAPEEWGLPLAVDPGDHVVIASAPDHPNRTVPVHVGPENPTATARIDTLDEPAAPAQAPVSPAAPVQPASTPSLAASAPEPPEAPPRTDPGATNRWVGIGVGAVGIVGLGIGSAFGLDAQSKKSQSNQPGNCDATDHCYPNGLNLRSDASEAANVSTVLFVIGGVAVAAGVVLVLTAPHAPSGAALTLSPAPMPGGGGALVRGTF